MSPSTPNVLLTALRGLLKPRFLVVIGTVSVLCILGFHHRDLDTTYRQIPGHFERIGNKILNGENFLQNEQRARVTTNRLDYAELIYQIGLLRRRQFLDKLGFGISPKALFEKEIAAQTGCQVFVFDDPIEALRQDLDDNPRVHLYKARLGQEDDQDDHRSPMTLQTLMNELGHHWIDVITIDLAKGEHQWPEELFSLHSSSSKPLPFGQLQVRTALPDSKERSKEEQEHEINIQEQQDRQLLQKQALSEFRNWFEALENAGLRPFRSDVDLSGVESVSLKGPYAVEYSFINIHGDHPLLRD
ncbi:hypothetical protein EC968_001071 [Mortierella alpina]|nr:hypothetical protein EC968_001071 [Mortierella alpina]